LKVGELSELLKVALLSWRGQGNFRYKYDEELDEDLKNTEF
jgi:hypothetical protein